MHAGERQVEAVYALVRLEQEDLGHALDGDRERYDDVVGVGGDAAVRVADRAERRVACLAEEQLLVRMVAAAGHQVAPLVLDLD